MRRFRRGNHPALPLITAGLAVAAALTGCGRTDSENSGSPTASAGTQAAPGQQRLNRIADQVRELGQRRFADSYAGVEVRAKEGAVIVYRRKTAEFDDALRAELPDAPVHIRDAPHTERELTRWATTIRHDFSRLESMGAPVHSVAVRHDGTCVQLGTQAVEAVITTTAKRYPDMRLCVVMDGPGWGATATPGSR